MKKITSSGVYFLGQNDNDIIIESGKEVILIDIISSSNIKRKITGVGGQSIKYFGCFFGDSNFEINLNYDFEGINSEVKTLFLNKNGQLRGKLSNNIRTPNVACDVSMVGMAGNNGVIDVDGSIKIEKNCNESKGFLSQENIFLDDTGSIKIIPRLDIYCNQVQASHGAKISKLDPMKIFYITSKGITQRDCKEMIISGYINNFFEQVDQQEKKNNVLDYILD
ncbi:SufD family Fe-S cluster assembly protein [Candidatus Absconditicoccus praedator]|uniref:SufD family Fe-S cluster assembly protein n=1 Tax=Candidatus Absconditicoccus praedator TaxID=2735562 RepID=UPI001E4F8431|nr:SufD family Fe-S cluster assembly protein [Candidatus Absconditicoccus praedator]UFX82975.1 SufD family Fe-S cluster assembly protein [Candidatus Absconditicoccus praedator]